MNFPTSPHQLCITSAHFSFTLWEQNKRFLLHYNCNKNVTSLDISYYSENCTLVPFLQGNICFYMKNIILLFFLNKLLSPVAFLLIILIVMILTISTFFFKNRLRWTLITNFKQLHTWETELRQILMEKQ